MNRLRNVLPLFALVIIIAIGFFESAVAQYNGQTITNDRKSAGGAFLRSVVLPGWGHRYVQGDWDRARIHLGADLAFLSATLGYNQQANTTKNTMYTTARQLAGVDVEGRNKAFQLAVSQYISLAEYNKTMEQTRNWDRFYEVNQENNWLWSSEEDRVRYNKLRGKSDDSRRQAGIFIGLMVINRAVSGVSSMVLARNHNRNLPTVVIVPDFLHESTGLAAHVTIRF
jgi:hypothetical protein